MARIQQRFVKLQKLLQIQPFKIVGLWSNGETRLNDFSSEVEQWRNGSSKELKKLANPKVFKTAFVKDGTLAFAGSSVNIPGVPGDQPVDFDRRVLYNDSQLIGNVVSYEDAIRHQKKRVEHRKRRISVVAHLEHKLPDPGYSKTDLLSINKLSKKIDAPIALLTVIGDELVELETTWTFSAL